MTIMLLQYLNGAKNMKSKGISFIFPVLNEDIILILKTIAAAIKSCSKRNLDYEFLFCDGGSNFESLMALKSALSPIEKTTILLDFPLIKPNKDIAIMNGSKLCSYEDIIICDVDIANITEKHFDLIIGDLLQDTDLVIPNLGRIGGRWNRLLCNPIMRLCFEKEYHQVPYPAPGILGIKKKILRRVVSEDFFYDWGGEIQIALEGAKLSKKITAPPMNKIDSEKRPIKNLLKDAFQVWRTNLYLFNKYRPKLNLKEYRRRYPSEHLDFETFLKEELGGNLKLFEDGDYERFLEKSYEGDPRNIFYALEDIYHKTGLYEFKVINDLVTRPLLDLLFGIQIENPLVEKTQGEIKVLKLRSSSIFVDYLAYFLISHSNITGSYRDFNYCLKRLDSSKTEFSNMEFVELARRNSHGGLKLNELSDEGWSKLKQILNIKEPIRRNMLLLRIFNDDCLGRIEESPIAYSSLNYVTNNPFINKDDFFIRLSIMTTIAGYLKKNDYTINGAHNHPIKLERFLSYMLNNKKYAPIDYKINLSFNEVPLEKKYVENNYDCIILFSGGIDSTAALLLALEKGMNPLLLWIGFGQKNEKEEFQAISNVSKKIGKKVAILRINLKKYIEAGWKDWDFIIPARNFIFVSVAAAILGNSKKKEGHIFMSAHKEEIKSSNTDKSLRFFRTCTELFSEYYNKKIIVTTPFYDVTKVGLLSYWRRNWLAKFKITPYETTTCYYGDNCGKCNACYKRNLALVAAGFRPDPDLKKDIFLDEENIIRGSFIKRINTFPKERKYEYIIALLKMNEGLPREIRDYLTQLSLRERLLARRMSAELEDINLLEVKWI
jgi:7-cyano-7-deazaguanine synthase in queuosine biosynthesis